MEATAEHCWVTVAQAAQVAQAEPAVPVARVR
jgi:hypothetical protein